MTSLVVFAHEDNFGHDVSKLPDAMLVRIEGIPFSTFVQQRGVSTTNTEALILLYLF